MLDFRMGYFFLSFFFTNVAEVNPLLDRSVCLLAFCALSKTQRIILSFVFTIKSVDGGCCKERGTLSLGKIKGHRVCHLETLLPSLLTHPEKGQAIIYLIPLLLLLLPLLLSSPPCTQPAGLWTHCGAWGQCCGQPALCPHGWAESEWGRLARRNQTGVWFGGVSCEGWISYTSQCCFWSKQRLGAVPGNIYTHCDFFLSEAKMHFFCFDGRFLAKVVKVKVNIDLQWCEKVFTPSLISHCLCTFILDIR